MRVFSFFHGMWLRYQLKTGGLTVTDLRFDQIVAVGVDTIIDLLEADVTGSANIRRWWAMQMAAMVKPVQLDVPNFIKAGLLNDTMDSAVRGWIVRCQLENTGINFSAQRATAILAMLDARKGELRAVYHMVRGIFTEPCLMNKFMPEKLTTARTHGNGNVVQGLDIILAGILINYARAQTTTNDSNVVFVDFSRKVA